MEVSVDAAILYNRTHNARESDQYINSPRSLTPLVGLFVANHADGTSPIMQRSKVLPGRPFGRSG